MKRGKLIISLAGLACVLVLLSVQWAGAAQDVLKSDEYASLDNGATPKREANNVNLLEAGIAAASAAVAAAAFFLSWRADQRAAALARTQMFLELRTRFLDVYHRLPSFDKVASHYTPEETSAVLAYWHHVFDEWYVTNHLNQRHMKGLWNDFYAPAILAGMRHTGMREVLFRMIDAEDQFGEYRRGFGDAMKELWKSQESFRVS
jgi:hypothetical protein